jgi:hypothetical protein
MAMTPEARAKKHVDKLLMEYKTYYITPTTAGYGASGAPDRVGSHRGRFFGVEVKADTNVTPLQKSNLARIERAGGRAFVVRIPSGADAAVIAAALEPLRNFLEEV